MEAIKNISNQRNSNMYSSKKNLVDDSYLTDDIGECNEGIESENEYIPMKEIDKKNDLTKNSPSDTSNYSETAKMIKDEKQSSKKGSKAKRKKRKKESSESSKSNNKKTEDILMESDKESSINGESDAKNESDDNIKDSDDIIKDNEKQKNNDKTVHIPLKSIGVHISHCDILKNDLFLTGPFVRLYIVKKETGESYQISKRDNERSLSTSPFYFHKRRSMTPTWNEILLFENDLHDLNDYIILFAIFDKKIFSESTENDASKEKLIAWAFIKPIGFNYSLNVNKKLKLQLFNVDSQKYEIDHKVLYECWKKDERILYPSALHVSIICVNEDISEQDVNLTKFRITQANKTVQTKPRSKKSSSLKSIKFDKRAVGVNCELPNKCLLSLQSFDGSTTMVKFSKCGNFLAFSAKDQDKCAIIVYKVPEFCEVIKFSEHRATIYDLCWNFNGNFLLSASADCTVSLWNISKNSLKQRLTHSNFVYAAQFCKFNEEIIATGSYDKLIRIWMSEEDSYDYSLSEELEGHTGTVNAICFLENVEMFFSGDSNGNLFKWAKGKDGWLKIMDLTTEDFRSQIINDLQIFPGGRRILVVLRNNNTWALDVTSFNKSTCYKADNSTRYQTRGVITPCGTFVLVGDNVWASSNGEWVARYRPTEFDFYPIISLDFHPHFNLIAASCGCRNSSVLVAAASCHDEDDDKLGLEWRTAKFSRLVAKVDRTESERLARPTFKAVAQTIEEEIAKGGQFKLWSLIERMDGVLLKAKKTKMFVENEKNKVSSDSRTTSKSDLEKPKTMNYRNEDVVHEIEESSTLSNAESLERDEDLNTYTISIGK